MTDIDNSKLYIKYAMDVLDGTEVACKMIHLACKRFIDWFSRDDIEFDYDDVDKKIKFVSKFKLSEDPFTGQPFVLLPYQQWIFANIFGWKYTGTNNRVIRNALLLMARKQGKTQLAAAIMLAAIVCDGKQDIAGYTIANSGEQAQIAFKHIYNLCRSIDPNQDLFIHGNSKIIKNIKSISIPLLHNSLIKVLNSDTSKLDGLNPQVFIQDEAHAATDDNIWGVLKTGQGSRHNPLAICISTTGFLIGDDYPLYAQWTTCKNILEGSAEDDSWFSALYQLDDEDDWKDSTIWKKACPSLDITVSLDILMADFKNAINNPSSENQFKTKQLNMWCTSSTTWIPYEELLENSKQFDLSFFNKEEEYCVVGVDMAFRRDLCVISTFVERDDIFYFKAFPFVCEFALENSKNKNLYKKWIKEGYLELIHAESVDIDLVIDKIFEIDEKLPVGLVAYDSWGTEYLVQKTKKAGMPARAVRQDFKTATGLVSEFEHRVATHKLVIDDNPVTRWCFGNVIMQCSSEARRPDKLIQDNKIDIVWAFLDSMKLWYDLNGKSLNTEPVLLDKQ